MSAVRMIELEYHQLMMEMMQERNEKLVAALKQAIDYIRDETLENMTREEARKDTIFKIRESLRQNRSET